jgi:hypothetical protein
MIIRALLFVSLFFSVLTAQAQHEFQIYLPGVQFRYEETSEQSIDLRSYTHFAVNYMYQRFLLGVEHNRMQDNSGSNALGVKTEMKEWNILAGLSVAKFELKSLTPHSNFELLAFAVAGQSTAEVKTSLIGQSQTNTADPESVIGVGGLVLFRLDYFIVGFDTRYMQSKAYQPNSVSVSSFKIGANFDY